MFLGLQIIIKTKFKSYLFDACTKRKILSSGWSAVLRTKWGTKTLYLMVLTYYGMLYTAHQFHYLWVSPKYLPNIFYRFFIIDKLDHQNVQKKNVEKKVVRDVNFFGCVPDFLLYKFFVHLLISVICSSWCIKLIL